ncbi:MAG: hypothetical protein R6V60_10965 [Desulfobacterales bacterium]
MDDPRKSTNNRPPIQPVDDEPIIDLIDEVPEGGQALGLSDLEKNLLEFERRFGASPAPQPAGERAADGRLPDLGELEDLDFEEADEAPLLEADSPATTGEDPTLTNLEQHLDWLFAEDSPPPAAGAPQANALKGTEVIEITEFDEQFPDAEEPPLEPAAATREPEPEEDETLELLDIEEDEPDDELIWFDTPETPDAAPPGLGSKSPETQAAAAAPPAPAAEAIPAAAAALARTAEGAAPKAPAAVDIDALPTDRIEAAVANVIARSYSSRIEAIILQAIEKAVAREIERLRNELLESEPGDRLF